jgi:hypothetical protein
MLFEVLQREAKKPVSLRCGLLLVSVAGDETGLRQELL